MESILEKLFCFVWLMLMAGLAILSVIAAIVSEDDDDPDDGDIVMIRAYSVFNYNIWHDTDYPDQEDEDDE